MIRREEPRGERTIRPIGRFVVGQEIPAALAAGLNIGQRLGYLTLLPLNAVIEKDYGNYALLLGAGGALVGGCWSAVVRAFSRQDPF